MSVSSAYVQINQASDWLYVCVCVGTSDDRLEARNVGFLCRQLQHGESCGRRQGCEATKQKHMMFPSRLRIESAELYAMLDTRMLPDS